MDRVIRPAEQGPVPTWVRSTGLSLDHVAGAYLALLCAFVPDFITPLMSATGMKAAGLQAILLIPLFAYLAKGSARILFTRRILPVALLFGFLSLSTIWSSEVTEGVVKAFALLTTLAYAAVFASRPRVLAGAIYGMTGYCILGVQKIRHGFENAGAGVCPGWLFWPPLVALFGQLYLQELRADELERSDEPPRFPLAGPLLRGGFYLFCIFELISTTFRAATMGGAAGLLLTVARRGKRMAGVTVLLLSLGGIAFALTETTPTGLLMNLASRGEGRANVAERYRSIDEDGFSGRTEIWDAILDDAKTGPTWVYTGVGLGDTDYHVGALRPDLSSPGRAGRPVLHAHSTPLDVFLGGGAPGLALLAWAMASVALGVRLFSPAGGLAIAIALIGVANGVFADQTGGTMTIGLLLALILLREARQADAARLGADLAEDAAAGREEAGHERGYPWVAAQAGRAGSS